MPLTSRRSSPELRASPSAGELEWRNSSARPAGLSIRRPTHRRRAARSARTSGGGARWRWRCRGRDRAGTGRDPRHRHLPSALLLSDLGVGAGVRCADPAARGRPVMGDAARQGDPVLGCTHARHHAGADLGPLPRPFCRRNRAALGRERAGPRRNSVGRHIAGDAGPAAEFYAQLSEHDPARCRHGAAHRARPCPVS